MKVKDTFFFKKTTINCNGQLLDLSKPKIMGILNITPDSFYDGGKHNNEDKILQSIDKHLDDGADIIDIGAYSSRPGANDVSEETELERLFYALDIVRKKYPNIIISVDTYRSRIAEILVNDYKINIINDISAGEMDNNMFDVIAKLNIPYIMMHMKGQPQYMQKNPKYDNLIQDIIIYFAEKVEKLKLLGINDIILDPGFGFGKTLNHNYEILQHLSDFNIFDLPLLIGVSRKSMIYRLLNITPEAALNGTTVLHTLSLLNGANILRVHDVKEAMEAIKLVDMYNNI
ncbi:MAG: dihydropteroate synthase [Bacteroidales bacterium]|jgi:dihydropteroate synthase|nr:dihydropteroate synthase [Bacteroidales bacterium]